MAGGQVLQAGDEGQPQRLARDHRRGRIVGSRDPGVRQRLQPRDLARRDGYPAGDRPVVRSARPDGSIRIGRAANAVRQTLVAIL